MGLHATLKQFNYRTVYFTTHDGQFDNIEGFLYHNSVLIKFILRVIILKKKYLSTLGVPDDYLFDFVTSKLDDITIQMILRFYLL